MPEDARANDASNNVDRIAEYLKQAAAACDAGNPALGMHLYLAAFGFASATNPAACEDAIDGLKRAWSVACSLKERSLAEYIFEKMEPYLSSDEVAHCAAQLQELALDKLEEYGLSREALQDMSDMISSDFLGVEGAHIMHVEKLPGTIPGAMAAVDVPFDLSAFDKVPEDGCVEVESEDADEAPAASDAASASADQDDSLREALEHTEGSLVSQVSTSGFSRVTEKLNYKTISGYQTAIETMAALGIGVADQPDFQALVALLNQLHGLDRIPAAETLLFRAPAREDSARFLQATLGEIGLPSLRMSMEENMQGLPVLCVMTNAKQRPKMNAARNSFEGPAVLVIEDLDLWVVPAFDQGEGLEGLMMSQLSRGAREAITLIHNAVTNPDVYVLASLSSYDEIDPFFCDLLAPLTVVDIDNPNQAEREQMWDQLVSEHASLAALDRSEVVALSANMSRADMYLAVREAIEEAYKENLSSRTYAPVTPENLLEKLSAYQPLESDEYQKLEENVVELLRSQLDGTVDDFLGR
ncbi:MAG: ribonucleotide reductase subunit alpha [Coriobacteriia bacterium]|nr:ribonucleotide reductase subunit alpha [Coriobacteriia bacterium]